jgi:hypothetical protein
MNHPSNRAERRHHRDRVVARRRFVYLHIWGMSKCDDDFSEWGRYAKWNLNCGCRMCQGDKYFGMRRKRREALKRDVWEWVQAYSCDEVEDGTHS